MKPQVGIRELRDNLTATIRRVRAGETLEVTHDGVPVALLSPVPTDRLARLVASGEVIAPTRPFEVPGHRFPPTTGLTASEALQEDRGSYD